MRATYRSVAFAAAAVLASTVLVGAAGAPALGATPQGDAAKASIAGTGVATASTVNVSSLAGKADTPPGAAAVTPQRRGTAVLPARPTVGTRPALPAASGVPGGPNTNAGAPVVRPFVAPPVVNNFEGIGNAVACGCQPPDVNAAVGISQIVETVNLRLQVFTKTGLQACAGVSLNSFLGTSDSLSDPRVQYDNVNGRYSFSVTVIPASASATPAIWVAASQTSNACGGWFRFRIGFSGGSFPAGTLLDYPILGQDRNALLIATDNFTPTSENFTVFGLPKSAVYSGAGFSFGAFNTASLVAPASNGGIPMIATPFSYFLGAVPGVGYRLYRLTNSGGPGATLTLQATVSSPFSPPTRRVNQPGTATTLDPLDGRIVWSPVNDGNFIWFAHGVDVSGFPSVRYGAISIASNTPFVAVAFHSNTSDDFNPSVGVGSSPGGGNFIYLNWAYTDTPIGVATSDTVDSVAPGGGVPNLIGTGVVIASGASTNQFRFGDYSSSTIDPTNANGSCALVAQQLFDASGLWRTRIARVGTC
ncbi:MAG: hypothetical protein V7603_2600 [Micromonosporaceae bacterium]